MNMPKYLFSFWPLNIFSEDDMKAFVEIHHSITNWKGLTAEMV